MENALLGVWGLMLVVQALGVLILLGLGAAQLVLLVRIWRQFERALGEE